MFGLIGAWIWRSWLIVPGVGDSLTFAASLSVPVFTGQRSLPHARSVGAGASSESETTTTSAILVAIRNAGCFLAISDAQLLNKKPVNQYSLRRRAVQGLPPPAARSPLVMA